MLTQLITPNPNIPCTPGLCLVYVRETFSLEAKHPTATAGWEASSRKHADQEFPSNAWVPIWFSLSDEPAGHVALRQPDGSIWSASHPTDTTPIHHESLQDILSYYGERLTYLGWTEDIEDTPIVAETLSAGSIDANGVGHLMAAAPDGPAIVLSIPRDHHDPLKSSLTNQQ